MRIGFEALLGGRPLVYAVDIPQPADRQMRLSARGEPSARRLRSAMAWRRADVHFLAGVKLVLMAGACCGAGGRARVFLPGQRLYRPVESVAARAPYHRTFHRSFGWADRI